MQEYGTAEYFLTQSMSFRERVYGSSHPLLATTLCDLGTLYLKRLQQFKHVEGVGDDAIPDIALPGTFVEPLSQDELEDRAKSMILKAIDMRARTLGDTHPFYAR